MDMYRIETLLDDGYTWEEAWDKLEQWADDLYDYYRDQEFDSLD